MLTDLFTFLIFFTDLYLGGEHSEGVGGELLDEPPVLPAQDHRVCGGAPCQQQHQVHQVGRITF